MWIKMARRLGLVPEVIAWSGIAHPFGAADQDAARRHATDVAWFEER